MAFKSEKDFREQPFYFMHEGREAQIVNGLVGHFTEKLGWQDNTACINS